MDTLRPPRRKPRIKLVMAEWLRNPLSLCLPLTALLLALSADYACMMELAITAECIQLLSVITCGAFAALLAVGLLR